MKHRLIYVLCALMSFGTMELAYAAPSSSQVQAQAAVTEITSEQQFQQALTGRNSTPLIVDFYSPYCGPCKILAPELEKMAQQYRGKVRVVKLNVSKFKKIASQYGIQAVPTLILFDKKGTVQQVGVGQAEMNSIFDSIG